MGYNELETVYAAFSQELKDQICMVTPMNMDLKDTHRNVSSSYDE